MKIATFVSTAFALLLSTSTFTIASPQDQQQPGIVSQYRCKDESNPDVLKTQESAFCCSLVSQQQNQGLVFYKDDSNFCVINYDAPNDSDSFVNCCRDRFSLYYYLEYSQ